MKIELESISTALIFGAGHGIGLALVQKLLEINDEIHIHATYRREDKAENLIQLATKHKQKISLHNIDPLNEEALQALAKNISHYDLLINSIGLLHNEDGLSPEKSLREVNLENLVETFKINAAITPLIAKHFMPVKNEKKMTCFVTISAKVGSLSDNRMGGWYGYRASKAALNMFIINIFREFERKKLNCLVLSIHPGTTITELSRPYTDKTSLKLHSPIETASNILKVISTQTIESSGKFFSWNGQEIPW